MRASILIMLMIFSSATLACEKHQREAKLKQLQAQLTVAEQQFKDQPSYENYQQWFQLKVEQDKQLEAKKA